MEHELPAVNDAPEVEIDLLDLFRYLIRRYKPLAASALAGLLVALFYIFVLATPMYEATAQLYVVNSKDSALDLSDLQIGTYLTSDYQLVFNTWEVNQQVRENLGLSYTVEELREMVTVTNPSDTRALFITVERPDPREAALLANEYAEVAKQYIYDTMLTDMPTMLSAAEVPTLPVRPRKLIAVALCMLLGFIGCAGVFVVRYLLDDKIKTASDLQKYTGAMPLAVIPLMQSGGNRRRGESAGHEGRRR